jgi:hypothetical protein
VTYTYGGIDYEGLIDGELRVAAKSFAYGAGTSMLNVSDVNFVWAARKVSWRDYFALWREASDTEDFGRWLQINGRMLALAESSRIELSAGAIVIGSPRSPAFSISNPRVTLEQRSRDVDGIEAHVGLHYENFAMPSLRSELGGLKMRAFPAGFDLEMTMRHLPIGTFFDSLLRKLVGKSFDDKVVQEAADAAAADFERALHRRPLDVSFHGAGPVRKFCGRVHCLGYQGRLQRKHDLGPHGLGELDRRGTDLPG